MHAESFIAIIDPPSFGQYSGTTNVRDGYGVAYFSAAEELETGAEAKITLEVRPRRSPTLRASVRAEVASFPATADAGEGKVATPNINPQWVNQGDLFWNDNNWNLSSVAKVVRGEASVEIFVSVANEKLSSLITKAQRRNVEAVESIKDFYLEHVSFHAFLEDADQASQAAKAEEEDNASKREQNRELARACETVCGIAESLFDLLVTSAAEAQTAEPAAPSSTTEAA